MTKIKYLLNIAEYYFLTLWGVTLLYITPLIDLPVFDSINNTIKTSMALFGAIYFAFSLPFKVKDLIHKSKIQKIEEEMKQEELEKIKRENDLANDDTNI